LPNFDELFVGLKDRTAFGTRVEAAGAKSMTSALSGHALVIDGQIVGGWKRTVSARYVLVEPKPVIRLTGAEVRGVGAAARKLGRYLDLPVEIRWP
jgi:winged helix DNA-binding protein